MSFRGCLFKDVNRQSWQLESFVSTQQATRRFPGGSSGKEPATNVGDMGSIPGNPVYCSSPGCSIHGISQARIWSG